MSHTSVTFHSSTFTRRRSEPDLFPNGGVSEFGNLAHLGQKRSKQRSFRPPTPNFPNPRQSLCPCTDRSLGKAGNVVPSAGCLCYGI